MLVRGGTCPTRCSKKGRLDLQAAAGHHALAMGCGDRYLECHDDASRRLGSRDRYSQCGPGGAHAFDR